jgi:hypothetical protein
MSKTEELAQRLDYCAALDFGSYDLTGADFSLIRAVERFHDIKE